MSPKMPKPVDCSRCIYKFNTNFSEESRTKLCQEYTKPAFNQQKEIVFQEERKRKHMGEGVDKEWSLAYYFQKAGKETRVCKKFFLKMLCIINTHKKNAFAHKSNITCNYDGVDKMGRKTPPNKMSPFFIAKTKKHIELFTAEESHCCRKSTVKKYLDSVLSIRKLYGLFVTKREEEKLENILNEDVYHPVFCTDQYHSSKGDDKAKLEEEYQQHLIRRNEVNLCKEEDKK
ncbi:hypothetical protein PR048_018649 [Dryococelus australis]|uniref:Uncharacterized protein n=1 Tax=Dryococelus australis TaxID=614101 RepID=A0ABQ9HD00_9NEOP|nr:hypothetical protein PR048_018649 [Dryococelus australis]